MDNNIQYWIKRYKDKGGVRTVGRSTWSDEDYIEFITRVEPILKDIFVAHCDPTSILDFGCGIGRWIPLIEDVFETYCGVDIVESALSQCRKNFPSRNIILMEDHIIPLRKESFDNAWTYVVLQHVIDLKLLENYIQQFHHILKPNGICIITENSAGNKTNNYMACRPPKIYIDIFISNGFKLDARYNKIKNHTTLVFSKK